MNPDMDSKIDSFSPYFCKDPDFLRDKLSNIYFGIAFHRSNWIL